MNDRLQWYRNRRRNLCRHIEEAGGQILYWLVVFDEGASVAFLVTVVRVGEEILEQVRLLTPRQTVLIMSQPLRGQASERVAVLMDLATALLSQQRGRRVPFPPVVIAKSVMNRGGRDSADEQDRQVP